MSKTSPFIALVLFLMGYICLPAVAQVRPDRPMNASSSAIKPKRLQDLQGEAQTIKKEILAEITREFNKCLPAKIADFIPYEDADSYIASGTVEADPVTGMAFFKSYRNEKSPTGSKVVISIIANSPMVSSLAMFLSNPTIARETGKNMVKYNGFDAIEEYDHTYRTGEINLLLSDNTLVTISATDIPDVKLLSEFAKSIDYKRILAIIE